MLESLKVILEIQELDIKMIRLIRLKKERQKELKEIEDLKKNLQSQITAKEKEIAILKEEVAEYERQIQEIKEKIKRFEGQQDQVKKMEEFNALNQEISQADRERSNVEQKLNKLAENLMEEEDALAQIQETYTTTDENSKTLEAEITESIQQINQEGRELKIQRDKLVSSADAYCMKIYERLLNNKRDRVVVPLTNRCCSGCHIVLTAQQENVIRKAEKLTFCEHCSRILFWPEGEAVEEAIQVTPKRRRRKAAL